MKSIIEQRGPVMFPQFTGERIYMRAFTQRDGLPFDLARWQPTVDAMLDGIDTDGPIYLMVDQGLVRAGVAQRRPGVHIDGYWLPAIQAHGGGKHVGAWDNGSEGRWKRTDTYEAPEAIILASSVTAARAFAGEFNGAPGEGGDCSHIDTAGLQEVILQAGCVYTGNVAMLHESLPVSAACLRTVVRLNVPGWSPA
jgi:hypothetical protein